MNNDRFKFRVWDITNNEYRRNSYIWTLNQIGYLTNDSMISLTSFSEEPNFEYIIEQSTGLKDKNGKLIFEGDLVVDKDGNKFVITWLEPFAGFGLFTLTGLYHNEDTANWLSKYEIIGNIHDKE